MELGEPQEAAVLTRKSLLYSLPKLGSVMSSAASGA